MNDKATLLRQAVSLDDPQRRLARAQPETDRDIAHIGIVGYAYTILWTGKDTAGKFCLIDMYVPPGGGPPPHRHDFEETFTMLESEREVVFRGVKGVMRAGEAVHVPANGRTSSIIPRRDRRGAMHLRPRGSRNFLRGLVRVATRTAASAKLDNAAQAEFAAKAATLAAKYRTEFLKHA